MRLLRFGDLLFKFLPLYLVKFFHVFGAETNDKIQGSAGAFAPALQEIRKYKGSHNYPDIRPMTARLALSAG